MTPELNAAIAALGPDLSPEMMRGTQALLAADCPPVPADVRITRDHAYGPDARNLLDIFTREGTANAPVLVYVHGGGFVMGDRQSPGLPFYDNVGAFAASHGMVGVTMTYRLAPAHGWPAGPDDMERAVNWLIGNIAAFGGDPARIYLMGQSAGAVHVASYVAHRMPRIAGALLVSCIHDVAAAHANKFHQAYYGEDESRYAEASSTAGLIATHVPLLITISEYDIADFQKQATTLAAAWGQAKGSYPPLLRLSGHNHLSPALSVGGPHDALGPEILNFISQGRAA